MHGMHVDDADADQGLMHEPAAMTADHDDGLFDSGLLEVPGMHDAQLDPAGGDLSTTVHVGDDLAELLEPAHALDVATQGDDELTDLAAGEKSGHAPAPDAPGHAASTDLRFGGHWETKAVYDDQGNWVSDTDEYIDD